VCWLPSPFRPAIQQEPLSCFPITLRAHPPHTPTPTRTPTHPHPHTHRWRRPPPQPAAHSVAGTFGCPAARPVILQAVEAGAIHPALCICGWAADQQPPMATILEGGVWEGDCLPQGVAPSRHRPRQEGDFESLLPVESSTQGEWCELHGCCEQGGPGQGLLLGPMPLSGTSPGHADPILVFQNFIISPHWWRWWLLCRVPAADVHICDRSLEYASCDSLTLRSHVHHPYNNHGCMMLCVASPLC
jgi:hypothetical protein